MMDGRHSAGAAFPGAHLRKPWVPRAAAQREHEQRQTDLSIDRRRQSGSLWRNRPAAAGTPTRAALFQMAAAAAAARPAGVESGAAGTGAELGPLV